MICKECGAKLPPDQTVCPRCGSLQPQAVRPVKKATENDSSCDWHTAGIWTEIAETDGIYLE